MESISDFRAVNYESITVDNTAAGKTLTNTVNSMRGQRAVITAETAQMRYRYDGTAPAATEGHLLEVGQTIEVIGYADISNFKIIRTGATSGVIKVTLEVY